MKILKFAKGGSQIGGRFAQYSASYTPLDVLPASTSTKSTVSTKSSKKEEDTLTLKDVILVFDNVKGLTSDVNLVIADFAKIILGELLTSFDGEISVSSLATKYLSNLAKVNALRNNLLEFDNIRTQLEKNNSLDEVAVDSNGNLIVLGEDGLDKVTVDLYMSAPGAYQVLTNHNLLDIRDKNPGFAFRNDIFGNISGIGMDSVIGKINSLVKTLGTTKQELLSDEMKSIAQGVEFILDLNEEGLDASLVLGSTMIVRSGKATELLIEQAQQAISSIILTLNPQELALIAYHSMLNGGSGVLGFLTDLIGSKTSVNVKLTSLISRIWTPSTGGKRSGSDNHVEQQIKDEKSNPLMQMLQQQGGTTRPITWITKDGTQSMGTEGTYYSSLNNIKENMSISAMLSESGIGGMLQSVDGITFGDQRIPSENLRDIMFDKDRGGYVAVLPCTTDTNGNKVVDLSIMDTYKEIVNSITEPKGTDAWAASLAKKIKEKGLSLYLMGDGSLDDRRFGLFLMVDGVTTDRWKFNTNSNWVEKWSDDDALAREMSRALSTNSNRDNYEVDIDDKFGWLEGGWDDIYKGTVYIPLNYNINAAINAFGDQVNISSARTYERDYQNLYGRKVQDADTNIGIDLLQ